jgi:hypothetical protein
MPKREKRKPGTLAKLFVAVWGVLFLSGLGSFIFHSPWTIIPISILVISLVIVTLLSRRKFKKLREIRREESICTFARSIPLRDLDTWVVRATYEELADYVGNDKEPFPIQATDRLEEDLEIDSEDLCDLFIEIVTRCERSLDDMENNPYLPKLKTVEDLIHAVMWQKREEK